MAKTTRRREPSRRNWSINHFSIANRNDRNRSDVPRLLMRLARELRALGNVEVEDITFHKERLEDGEWWPDFTVYFYRRKGRKRG